jgi:hypothetical protein
MPSLVNLTPQCSFTKGQFLRIAEICIREARGGPLAGILTT